VKSLRKWLVEVFGFGQSESRGFIVFLGFVIAFSIISLSVPGILFKSQTGLRNDQVLLAEFAENVQLKASSPEPSEKDISPFDPNKLDYFDWKDLGLKPTLANRIISYRVNGGRFAEPRDLLKIYGFNDSLFASLSPYIKIEKVRSRKKYQPQVKEKRKDNFKPSAYKTSNPLPKILPDINSCDSTDLLFIKGIGPSRASRILKYRDMLGGFHHEDQLDEVYGLDSTVLTELKSNISLERGNVNNAILINSVSFKELLKHPYFDYSQTKAIINYRKQHGSFGGTEDLRKIKILDAQWLEKVAPYLNFDSAE
jgi:DNA uptake protein ComE-like DNA-binding protein